jgi:hypothetical protein
MNEEPQSTIVMKELSDLKEKLATNTEATKNVNQTLTEIKSDLKVFQNSFVTHDEFNPIKKDIEMRMRRVELWGAITIGALYAVEAYFNFIK